ncbi:MAG TPA: chemotaxis protein CheB [Candidatus Polarisedimenticolaceae bacterium]|nr:chemotaxis protein CheB [Candidatus Polarisedimenticolaceae bacterium]
MSAIEQNQPNGEAALALVAIACSAGALGPLRDVVGSLPRGFPAAVVIAQHLGGWSVLPQILANDTELPVTFADAGETLHAGTIYVCPPKYHIAIAPDARIMLSARERLQFIRPSADWLFESAAAVYGDRAIGVVLSGMRNDGAYGASRIKRAGGRVIVQDPRSTMYGEMPAAAAAAAAATSGGADFILPPRDIGDALVEVVQQMNVEAGRDAWERPFVPQSTK